MLLDASIPAHHPAAVAGFIAELWGGEALPAPPVPGRFVALAADGTGAGLEVLPAGLDRMRTSRDTLAGPVPEIAAATTRLAIGTALDEAEVHLAAGMRGWQSRRALRSAHGHAWGVIEVWIEERLLVEVLTPAMQAEFRAARAEAAPGEAAPGRVLMVAA